jgi:putative SOS response-associated peptidase YedK
MCVNVDRFIKDKEIKKKMRNIGQEIEYDNKIDKKRFAELKENIRLTNDILVILNEGNKPKFSIMKWGIMFSPVSPIIFNSRIETIRDEKRWKTIFSNQRCIVPVTGFIEYRKLENDPPDIKEYKKQNKIKNKTQIRISLEEEDFFFIPAIFVTLKDGNNYNSLITTEPNNTMRSIPYHRMCAIAKPADALDLLFNEPDWCIDKIKPFSDKEKMKTEQVTDM